MFHDILLEVVFVKKSSSKLLLWGHLHHGLNQLVFPEAWQENSFLADSLDVLDREEKALANALKVRRRASVIPIDMVQDTDGQFERYLLRIKLYQVQLQPKLLQDFVLFKLANGWARQIVLPILNEYCQIHDV